MSYWISFILLKDYTEAHYTVILWNILEILTLKSMRKIYLKVKR